MDLLEQLCLISDQFVRNLDITTRRKLFYQIDWTDRLVGLIGARGVGKTTLMLQKLKELKKSGMNGLYISLDNPVFSSLSLYETAENFATHGGEILFLDEVHKYEDWSGHVKSIFDTFKDLKVVFSGSSALHLHKGRGDLSRRAGIYTPGIFSFREFLELETKLELASYSIEDINKNHREIAEDMLVKIKPLQYFNNYLQYGAYPFFLQGKKKYHSRLQNIINQVIETDLVMINNIEGRFVNKLKKLLYMISTSLPFQPNILKLSEAIGISRPLLYQYLEYLQQAGLIFLLRTAGKGYSTLTRPEKIYLDNTGLIYTLCRDGSNLGNLRETFFISQLKTGHLMESSPKADFFVDGKWTYEVGGKNKGGEQISGIKNAFMVSDNLETGIGNRIPLWLFGFLY